MGTRGFQNALACVVLIGVVVFNIGSAAMAGDAPGCVGLGDYRTAMMKIEREYLAAVGLRSVSDSYALTTADFQLIGAQTRIEVTALQAVSPPSFALQWHEATIARAKLRQQMALAAIQRGIYALSLFKGADDYAAREILVALTTASSSCGAFAQFAGDFNALSGVASGTPVATPAS